MRGLKRIILFLLVFISISGFAQEPLDTLVLNPEVCPEPVVTDTIISPRDTIFPQTLTDTVGFEISYPDYPEWKRVSLQGKLKMHGLPLSPTLKIFMLKDSLIDISVRAPFIGEAAKIELNRDSITAINKMNKTYVRESVGQFLKFYPGGISNVQDMLLGRFFLPGFDISQVNLDELIEVFYEDNQFNVVPIGEAEVDGIRYGFVVDEEFNPMMLIVIPEERPDIEISAFYSYKLGGYDLQFVYKEENRSIEATLEMKEPEWKGDIPKPIEVDRKYRRLSIGDFVRSF